MANQNGNKICKHKGDCKVNAIKSAYQTFVGVFAFKFLLSVLINFRKLKKIVSVKALYDKLSIKDTFIFSLVFTMINFTYKFLLCIMRKFTCLDDFQIAPICGFISGLCLFLDPSKSRRNLISTLMASRAVSTLLN